MKSSISLARKENILLKACRYFGSLRLAIFLIVILALILVFSTFYESLKSTELAQRFVYATWWFDFYLTLFALNVFCAVVLRYPFQKRHTGFIITHLGILIICLGSAINRHVGIEGQMYLTEGDALDHISFTDRVVEVELNKGGAYRLPADAFRIKDKLHEPIRLGKEDFFLAFLDYQDSVTRQLKVVDSGVTERNPAVVFEMKSEMAGFNEEHSLIYFDQENPHGNSWSIGPATFRLVMALSDAEEKMLLKAPAAQPQEDIPYLVVQVPDVAAPIRIPVKLGNSDAVPVPSLDAELRITEYFPSARVVGNELVNQPDTEPNPAVRFELKAKDGRIENHTAFALFPEFDTLHGSAESGWSHIHAQLEASATGGKGQPKASFTFVQGMDEKLRFVSEASKEGFSTGEVALGEWQSAGWMDFQFRVKEYFPRALAKYEMTPVDVPAGTSERSMSERGQAGVQLELGYVDPSSGTEITSDPQWLMFGESKTVSFGDKEAVLVYRYRADPVPFSLKLIDFRRTFYPSTRTPASYESDVVLHDHSSGVTMERKIYMNHPLDYKGFRIFQSSFVEVPPGEPEISVFQVAKAPGTNTIYVGSIVMVLGIITMFYIKPFSSSVPQKNSVN